jgi:hypothetical protein
MTPHSIVIPSKARNLLSSVIHRELNKCPIFSFLVFK